MAAVLACGPDAAPQPSRSPRRYTSSEPPPGMIDVTAATNRAVPGVRCHRSRCLRKPDRTVIDGIPVTSLNRTLLDMATLEHHQRLRSLLEAVQRRELLEAKSARGAA